MRGGKREGAGRKPKEHSEELIEKLSPLEDVAFKAMKHGIESGDYKWTKLYFEYRYGKPVQFEPSYPDEEVTGITLTIIEPDGTRNQLN